MGVAKQQKEAAREPKKSAGGGKKRKFAHYIDFRPNADQKRTINKALEEEPEKALIECDSLLWGEGFSLQVKEDEKNECFIASIWDERTIYENRVYLRSRHRNGVMALNSVLYAFVTLYDGLPPNPELQEDDYNW